MFLQKTKLAIKSSLHRVFSSSGTINNDDFIQIEKALLTADVGRTSTDLIIKQLKQNLAKKGIVAKDDLLTEIKLTAAAWLEPFAKDWQANSANQHETILVFGINGAGKTTSIAKIANLLQNGGKKVSLVAGDTYRAAAVEQLAAWGEKLAIPVITKPNTDSAALIFDAIKMTQEQDIVIADTSGRLHNNVNLMQELSKIVRVSRKADTNAPQHRWLVLDATLGLNNIAQAKTFHEHLSVNGIIITKLDSSAKAGAIFTIARELAAPILFITTGEQISDISHFNAQNFVDNLFD